MIRLEMKNYYDINRETSKILALSSNELRKFEYLTGQEILPSNQKQVIEQAKFSYSPLGKAFEKQIKTIKDQGKKEVKALENLKQKEQKAIEDKSDENLSMQKKIYNKLLDERTDEIREIAKEIDYNKLIYYFKGPYIAPINFIKHKGLSHIFKEIRDIRG